MPLRKRVGEQPGQRGPETEQPGWLPLEELAEATISSEDPSAPLEAALVGGTGGGWRAATPGEQSLRIHFDQPQNITLIHLVFDETEHERVQEFALQWSDDRGRTFHPVVRQQFSFSPSGATREIEDYTVNLRAVTDLDLHIVPDVSGRPRFATLTALRLR
jgi:hypothetical protein